MEGIENVGGTLRLGRSGIGWLADRYGFGVEDLVGELEAAVSTSSTNPKCQA
jgi:hypothetical protein